MDLEMLSKELNNNYEITKTRKLNQRKLLLFFLSKF